MKIEKSSTTKVSEHIPCGYSMSTIWTLDVIENKHNVCRSEECMKKFCESLTKYPIQIINFEKKKMIPLTNRQKESYEKGKICNISKKLNIMTKFIVINTIVIILVNTDVPHISYVI